MQYIEVSADILDGGDILVSRILNGKNSFFGVWFDQIYALNINIQ